MPQNVAAKKKKAVGLAKFSNQMQSDDLVILIGGSLSQAANKAVTVERKNERGREQELREKNKARMRKRR